MRIGIIGPGVGSALARGFSAAGHDVVLGSRDPANATPDLRDRAGDIELTTQGTAAAHGEAVVLAVPASVVTTVAETLAAELASDVGFDVVVTGGLPTADHLENLARFWIRLSAGHGRDIAFRFLRSPE